VVGLYIAPPKNAIVLCVDEKPSIQAQLPNGRALTGQSHDYKTVWHDNPVRGLRGCYRQGQGRAQETPTRASWLNQVECWFSILQGRSLTGASLQLMAHIDAFIKTTTKTQNRSSGPNRKSTSAASKVAVSVTYDSG
jgi:hypothetical protein